MQNKTSHTMKHKSLHQYRNPISKLQNITINKWANEINTKLSLKKLNIKKSYNRGI